MGPHIIKLFKKICNRETITYLICGGLTTLVGITFFWFLLYMQLHTVTANTISTMLAVLFAYVVNKVFVFRSGSWHLKTITKEAASFFLGRAATYVMETGLLVLLIDVFRWPGMGCKIITSVFVVVGNYFISKWLIFKK